MADEAEGQPPPPSTDETTTEEPKQEAEETTTTEEPPAVVATDDKPKQEEEVEASTPKEDETTSAPTTTTEEEPKQEAEETTTTEEPPAVVATDDKPKQEEEKEEASTPKEDETTSVPAEGGDGGDGGDEPEEEKQPAYVPQSGEMPDDLLPRKKASSQVNRIVSKRQRGGKGPIVRNTKKSIETKAASKITLEELSGPQKYVYSNVISLIGESETVVLAGSASKEDLAHVNKFFLANPPFRSLLFSRTENAEGKASVKLLRSSGVALAGLCIFCVRSGNRALSAANAQGDVSFGSLPLGTKTSGLLTAFHGLMNKAIMPALTNNTNWGKLDQNDATKEDFFLRLRSFVESLSAAKASVDAMVTLKKSEEDVAMLAALEGPKSYMAAANKSDVVDTMEQLINTWCKQITGVIIAHEQIRSESDTVGPRAELEHWKHRTAAFNGLLDQMKEAECVAVTSVLKLAKSRSMDEWRELDTRITEEANEAKDNLKFLQTLDILCEPLYKHNLEKMEEALPALLNAVAMMYSTSRFYNTSEHMSALFVKITNQMITSSREFVYQFEPRLWEQEPSVLLKSLANVRKLHLAYQKCFYHEQARLAKDATGVQFDFSIMSIFGKSIKFIERIEKIEKMVSLIVNWSKLARCKIEGIEPLNITFRTQFKATKAKPYDPLDIRKQEFEGDLENFFYNMEDNLDRLQMLCDGFFGKGSPCNTSLRYIEQFEQLSFLGIDLTNHYNEVLGQFGRELEFVRKAYQKDRHLPPVSRNVPPIAGGILWSRQLFARVQRTMAKLQALKPEMLSMSEAKKVIKNYNKLGKVLFNFEQVYYNGWLAAVDDMESTLRASLFVFEGNRLRVNWDNSIAQLLDETRYMQKLNLDIPDSAKRLLAIETQLKAHKLGLDAAAAEYDIIMSKIPTRLAEVYEPLIAVVNSTIEPGQASLNWKSASLADFIDQTQLTLHTFEAELNRVLDVLNVRIDGTINAVKATTLCALPTEQSWTVAEFELENEKRSAKMAHFLQSSSVKVEKSVDDLMALVRKQLTKETLESEDYQDKEAEVRVEMATLMVGAVVSATKTSLDTLKRSLSHFVGFNEADKKKVDSSSNFPILTATIILSEDGVKMNPELDDVQQSVVKVSDSIKDISKSVPVWGDEGATKSMNNDVCRHKDVIRLTESLSTVVNSTKGSVTESFAVYEHYSALWKDDRDKAMDEFLETKPDISAFEDQVAKYDELELQLEGKADSSDVGAILLDTTTIKKTLVGKTSAWKTSLGKALNDKSSNDMKAVFDFSEDLIKRLTRPIVDLEDVRLAMESVGHMKENEFTFDTMMAPIEAGYQMLGRNNVKVAKEEQELLDSMRFNWNKMTLAAGTMSSELVTIQAPFREKLITSVTSFQKDQAAFVSDYNIKGPMQPGIVPREASDRLAAFQVRFSELWKKYVTYSSGEVLFGLPQTEYPDLARVKKELTLLQKLYGLYNDVVKSVNGYYDIKWVDVDPEYIQNQLTDFGNRCRKLPKALKEWDAYLELQKVIDDFSESLPLLEAMASKTMLPRHWKRIEETCKYKFDVTNEAYELRGVMEAPLLQHKEDIEDICIASIKEEDIDAKLKAVIKEWSAHNLTFGTFKNRGELLVKAAEVGEFITVMEDSLMILGSLMSNRYNPPFKASIVTWQRNLSDTSEILERWLIVQNLWVYLEAVFVGGDIAKQLPKEAKRFTNIDKSWVRLMTRAHEDNNLIRCCVGDETMKTMLPHLLEQLEVCQKSLTGYLEKKRLVFPRFFFVSDPVLLEILGQASDSHTIQEHLPSLFDNVHHVTFHDKNYDDIIKFHSAEGEEVDFNKTVKAQGNVEQWVGSLLHAQQSSIGEIIADATLDALNDGFADKMVEYMRGHCSQVGILGIQILWTQEAEVALSVCRQDKKAMATADDLFLNLLTQLIDQTLLDLTKLMRRKFETLVTLHVHQRDIFHDDIIGKKVKSPTDFEWAKQARFYINEETRKLTIQITDWTSKYCLEFIGCVERLCVTPLTDRCYITIGQALLMSMGAAPAGPAGTGKTETTKDVGRALGKYVVVFNCSDQMDFRGLGRIYKGLAQSGSWGCFDEFNRIELPVLSVAAQQIKIVLDAKLNGKRRFIFMDGDDVSLDPEFGLFLTMNPGYAGRQELPENLKIQFRTVAMMVPDRQIIIRVKLAACGFQNNVVLARKFYTLYVLCEEQLTKQVHYDFGLRNILSVVRTLGAAKRQNPDDSEMKVVMRVLRDMNLSKMVDQDEPLFLSLIDDLFPGITLGESGYPELEEAIGNEVEKANLINHPMWNLKLIQLFETQRVRHGFMVLGPSGAGKTENINCLTRAMTATGTPHREMRMNPKAITAPQMFGRLDVATNDWTDGIFSTLWRRSLKAKKGEKIWIVLDGPIDAVWIENLNSVLDDNKLLTLANGDRIPMSPDAKLVFEPHNVDNASPATVSRNGMVFMSSSALDWKPLLEAWFKTRPPGEVEPVRECFEKSYQDLQMYCRFTLKNKMVLLECNYIKQCLDLLTGLVPTLEEGTVSPDHLRNLYVFAVMWSLGSVLELDDRQRLQEFLASHPAKLSLPKMKGKDDSIFDYVVDDGGAWVGWNSKVPLYDYPVDAETALPLYNGILVPNVDNTRTAFLLDTIAKQGKPVLLMGESGTAKTVILKNYCLQYDPEERLFKTVAFSSTTTPNGFQRTIESYVDKRMGTTYGPPANRKMTVFIDDINMPIINEWKDQITNEIVRQTMAINGFYSLDKPGDFITLADMQYIAAMPHPGGGRNDIPERLKRQFSIFNCTLPSNASIETIFTTITRGYFHSCRDFSAEVVEMAPRLVTVTRRLWQDVKVKMLPTPAKFHYVFNLRDMSRIFQGMLTINADECPDACMLIKLFVNECTRTICDRFTNKKDVIWFDNRIRANITEDLGDVVGAYIENDKPFFVDFMRDAPELTGEEEEGADIEAPKVYELVPSMDLLKDKLKEYMDLYNETVRGTKMDLVFFLDCMIHIIRVSRIIRTSQGNAMLVGVGGSGKQSVARLSSAIARYHVFQITLTRTYNQSDLLTDIKELYKIAGVKGQGVTFILTDNEIKSESFLEAINNLLSTGEIGGMLARDEIDEITSELLPAMKEAYPRRAPTNDALYDFFIERVRSNLHTVLCFSPVSEKFRSRALKFPAVYSGCTMDWFMAWPKDALIGVADHSLGKFQMTCTPEVKAAIVNTMGVVQDGVGQACEGYFEQFRRQTYVTPASYLSFLGSYRSLYSSKKAAIDILANQMKVGLEKLEEAAGSVTTLSAELAIKTVELAKANKETEAVLVTVTASAAAAEKVKAEVQVVKDRAQGIVDQIDKDKIIAEGKLAAAVPALAAAQKALETITGADISTVKKLGKPPHLIKRIMDVTLLLFGRKLDTVVMDADDKPCPNPSWGEALKTMSGPFLADLSRFNKDTINEEMVELMDIYVSADDYNFETAKKACGNVAGLCSWTEAMASFYWINKEVLPLKANLAIAQVKLDAATLELNAAQATLDEKQKELDEVQAMYEATMKKKQELQDDADTCQRKMTSASLLIEGLGGEKIRWTAQSKEFDTQIRALVGDVLTMCAFMSYSGPFNAGFRQKLLTSWREMLETNQIPYTAKMDLINELVDNVTASEWALQGLPVDPLSLQNGIITTKATRYPLMIDPQGQGKLWIKNKENENGLQVTALSHKYFRTHLDDALGQGKPLLIEDVGEFLDPCLDNVLAKNFIKSGSTLKVKVGDKECDVMEGFRLYITTKLANPAYTPEVFAATSIIDFTVTMKGLEDQLLARVIEFEKAELEEERVALATEVTENKKKMKELEDNLLDKLVNTQGSLVDDPTIIGVLQTTKSTAEDVNEKIRVADETTEKIGLAREEYRPIAVRGSIVYFLVVELSMVNPMYQTSLEQFLGVFNKSLKESTQSPVPTKRIDNIIEFFTYEAYCYTIRGLYTTDKFLLTIMLAMKIDMRKEKLKKTEFDCFIKGGAALDLNAVEEKAKPWILDSTWLNLVQLSSQPQFSSITRQIKSNDKGWKMWFDEAEPEECPVPDGYDKLDTFSKLLLIRSWCPDRTTSQARKYIGESLGQRFTEAVLMDMNAMVEESNTKTPLVCFLSLGSDPTDNIMGLAKKKKLDCKDISMGQGQEVHARKLLANFQENGGWVLLQNCHLCLDFLEELQATVEQCENPHEQFRLWVTTEENPEFPINFLQFSIKFTNEPPQGLKAGIKRTFTAVTQDMLDLSTAKEWKPLMYGVAFLHSVVQERRKFGPLGWNIPYEFNAGDLAASTQMVQNAVDDLDPKKGIIWTAIRYHLGEVQYGGRVTDDRDKRLLNTFALRFFSDKMFDTKFDFHKNYPMITCPKIGDYMPLIESLPAVDKPGVFGLHGNADISCQSQVAAATLNTILDIQPKESGGGGGESREEAVARMSTEFLEKMPADFVPHEVLERLKIMGQYTPMNIFLRQEIDRMQKVIFLVRVTLKNLLLAIDGTIIMSDQLRSALDSMYDARTPPEWAAVSWHSVTLGFWFTELLQRQEQFYSWCFDGRPLTFWMTGFFNPNGFITAMRQEVTRSQPSWALDSVVCANEIMDKFQRKEDVKEAPAKGVYIYGLFLDGAGWDAKMNCLTEQRAKVLYVELPVLWLHAINSTSGRDVKQYFCPIYKKPRRQDPMFVCFVDLQSGRTKTGPIHPDHWTLRGTALLCDTK